MFAHDKEKIVKIKARECVTDCKLYLNDLSLDIRGPKEDEAFAVDPVLAKNIRRGNTLIEVMGNQGTEIVFGRKGLPKFFDLSVEFVDPDTRYDDSYLPVVKQNLKNYQLAGPLKAMLSGHQVEVIKTLKANGENASISWCPAPVNAWVIASKNVGLIYRQREDIERWNDSSHSFANEIAEVWFDKVE